MTSDYETKRVPLSGNPPADPEPAGAPQPIDPKTGMHGDYWVLSEEERAKGFVRPVREVYTHVGTRPRYPLRDLTPEEQERYAELSYVKFEAYPDDQASSVSGRYWTQAQLDSGCGVETRMAIAIAETYARSPNFYGATFCCHCRKHFHVGEFRWEDGTEVGS